jgi:hypothetical protein
MKVVGASKAIFFSFAGSSEKQDFFVEFLSRHARGARK